MLSFVATAYFRVFEPLMGFGSASRRKTTEALRSARIRMLPEWYLSLSYLTAGAVALVTAVASGTALWFAAVPGWAAALLVIGAAFLAFATTRLGFLAYPRLKASSRAKAIDAEFQSVVTLCYALARGGVNAMEIFRAVAQERELYGEISLEFEHVMREIEHTGRDLNTALTSVAATTPSVTLRAFLDGLVTMLNSGADPRDYFRRQATLQLESSSLTMEREIEQAGLLAEGYVSGLLVLPLLLVVVLVTLSAIKNVGATMIGLIVFVLIPVGTFMFVLLLDMMLPPPSLVIPRIKSGQLNDCGLSTISRDHLVLPPPPRPTIAYVAEDLRRQGFTEKEVRWRRFSEWMARRIEQAWREFHARAIVEPMTTLYVSGAASVGLAAVGVAALLFSGVEGRPLAIALTTLLLFAMLVAFLPVAIFHELRMRRARTVDEQLPEVLSKLAGFNEKGVSLLRSFQILGRTTRGELGNELRRLDRDVSWTANLRGALQRMRSRVNTRRMTKVGVLFDRGVGATGNLKEVIEIAAAESAVSENQIAKKRQSLMSYMIVVYVVFLVFLYVVYMVTQLFFGADGFAAAASGSSVAGLSGGIEAPKAQLLFFQAVILQGLCCGFVAGKLGEGHVLSGIKHAAIMSVIGWAVFRWGVLA